MNSCGTCENKTVSFGKRGDLIVSFRDHDFIISPERILNNLLRTPEGRTRINNWSEKKKRQAEKKNEQKEKN